MNEALQQSLYDKLSREQDKYRDWLKGQPPEEILHHSYEYTCLLYTSPSPRDYAASRMPSSA